VIECRNDGLKDRIEGQVDDQNRNIDKEELWTTT